ncbi:hypothetical protein [Actinophytocola sp.]|uniref:hypothetical protein n=1 Tax=Actinophytocola sp. TaxID=1872138 RepID=UPI003D6BA224
MTSPLAHQDRLSAARQALADLGVTVADLQATDDGKPTPTLAEYLPTVIAAAGTGANRTYGTYWARMAAVWGDRRLDEIRASDIEGMKSFAAASDPPPRPPPIPRLDSSAPDSAVLAGRSAGGSVIPRAMGALLAGVPRPLRVGVLDAGRADDVVVAVAVGPGPADSVITRTQSRPA